jgi:S1-C subfamily serine protease
MLKEFDLRAKWEAGKLSATDLFVYPLPQTIGLTTDVSDGLQVTAVRSGSVAATAGIAAGDSLVSINGQPLVSLADVQWALHTTPNNGPLAVTLKRGSQTLERKIVVSGDWKRSDIAWRASSWLGLRKGLKTEPLSADEKQAKGIAADRLALSVKGIYGQGEHPAKTAGLLLNDVIVAVDGQSAEMDESEFLVDLRLKHGPRDSVKFTVLRDGGRRHELTIPMW